MGTDEASNKISEVKKVKMSYRNQKIVNKYEITDNSISGVNSTCYCTWEDFTFELLMTISDEKEWNDYPAQFGYIRIKTPDALEIIKSDQFQNWLFSKENKYTIERIISEAKKYGMEEAMEIIFGKK